MSIVSQTRVNRLSNNHVCINSSLRHTLIDKSFFAQMDAWILCTAVHEKYRANQTIIMNIHCQEEFNMYKETVCSLSSCHVCATCIFFCLLFANVLGEFKYYVIVCLYLSLTLHLLSLPCKSTVKLLLKWVSQHLQDIFWLDSSIVLPQRLSKCFIRPRISQTMLLPIRWVVVCCSNAVTRI